MIQHNHSLIIIKNSAPGIKTKYLTYYDERWDCKLFPNLKTADKDNEAFIIWNFDTYNSLTPNWYYKVLR